MGRSDVYRRIVSIFCFIGYVWHVSCLEANKKRIALESFGSVCNCRKLAQWSFDLPKIDFENSFMSRKASICKWDT